MSRFIVLALLFAVGVLHSASGYCCSKKAPNIASHIAVCQDCTLNEWCCAYGRCNVFCCNCDDGCRVGDCWREHPKGKRDLVMVETANGNYSFPVDEKSGYTIVREGDKDGNGLLSIEEAHELLVLRGALSHGYQGKEELQALDLDKDNHLSPLEIDRDANYYDD